MAHEGLWEQLAKLDGQETAQRAQCQYLEEADSYIVTMVNRAYVVCLSDMRIFSGRPDSQQEPASFLEQLCLLAYLINARDLPLSNTLVNAQSLPGGQFFFRGPHTLPTEKLKDAFGDCPEALNRASEPFAARRCEFGDASITLDILPRVPLTIVIWRRCEEFDARASILFDKSVAIQLPLDALMAAVNLTVGALLRHSTGNN
ncbi:MAG: DUF3786 domain-containing protein [Planctomycetota bacterium]